MLLVLKPKGSVSKFLRPQKSKISHGNSTCGAIALSEEFIENERFIDSDSMRKLAMRRNLQSDVHLTRLSVLNAFQYFCTAPRRYFYIETAKVRLRIMAAIWSFVTGMSTLRLSPEGLTVTPERAWARSGSDC